MKQFRPYHFPPLAQFTGGARQHRAASASSSSTPEQDWQGALADGFRQGQQDGYDVGLEQPPRRRL
jgi:flagellar assembly protein FliH